MPSWRLAPMLAIAPAFDAAAVDLGQIAQLLLHP